MHKQSKSEAGLTAIPKWVWWVLLLTLAALAIPNAYEFGFSLGKSIYHMTH